MLESEIKIGSKVTSKLQVTVPKALAERFGIRPGDEIEWQGAGAVIRVIPPAVRRLPLSREERLRLFDEASARRRQRTTGEQADRAAETSKSEERGWRRENLYRRGDPR